MIIYFKTDSISGTIKASSLKSALEKLDERENITDTLQDGSWAWVEDSQSGERIYIRLENMNM